MEQAVCGGNLKQVTTLIGRGVGVNAPPRGKVSLLIVAIAKGYQDIALALLAAGAYVHVKDKGGWTALHWASSMGLEDVVQTLIDRGSKVNERNANGHTPLMLAERAGVNKVTISMRLLRAGASCEGLTEEQLGELLRCASSNLSLVQRLLKYSCSDSILSRETQEELLCHACHMDDVFVVHILLKNGCTISVLSREKQEELLRRACHKGDVFVAQALVKNGCSGRKLEQADIVYLITHFSNEEIEELLSHACHGGDVFVVHSLLKNGYSISVLSREEQEELLFHACHGGDVFVVHRLLKSGCGISVLSREEQEKLLCHACHEGDVFVVHSILKNGYSISVLSREEQEELLRHACHEGDVFVVSSLLKTGCSISVLSRDKQEELLCQACHGGDVFVAQALIKNGCSGSKLKQADFAYLIAHFSKEEIEKFLRHACHGGDVFVVHSLLQNGCNISVLSREEQEKLLCHAYHGGDVFVVHSLLKIGCPISVLSREEQEELLRHACHVGAVFVVHSLLKNGCTISVLSREEQEKLICHACHRGNMFVVHTLLKNGCTISVLSREEQEQLLCHACYEGDVFVVESLLAGGCNVNCVGADGCTPIIVAVRAGYKEVALVLLEKGADVHAKDRDRRTALHWACVKNLKEMVELLIGRGSQVNEEDNLSHTPLKLAQKRGNEALSMLLLQAGANCKGLRDEQINFLYEHAFNEGDMMAIQTLLNNHCKLSAHKQEELLYRACREGVVLIVEAVITMGCNVNCINVTGSTPLMEAARKGHEEVVKKLILAGAKVEMQDEHGETALHHAAIHNHIQCGILLAEAGASMRAVSKFAIRKTPLDIAKTEFKEAIHQALSFTTRKALCIIGNAEGGKSTLIAALQAESNSFLGKMVNRFKKVTDRRQRTAGIETILHSSQRYGEVVFFDFAGQHEYHGPHQMFLESLLSKPGVSMTLLLVVKMTEEEEAILHQLHRWLSPVALKSTTASPAQIIIIGSFLDIVKSKQEATTKVTRCIETTMKNLEDFSLDFVGSCFLNCRQPQSEGIDQLCHFLQEIPIPEFSAAHTQYSLAWVLYQIRSSIKAQAVQLQEFSTWVQDNKDNLPRTMPTPEEVCQDLSAAGHALYLPNKEDPCKSWLVLDLPSILHDVYGTLFSQSREIVNEFGLLHCQHLAKLFPHLDLEMVQQLLISLEFCIPVDPSILKVEVSKLTQCEETSGWLFFPALIFATSPQPISEGLPQQKVHHLCWQLRTSKTHSISAHVLQTILLRMAAHFVVKQHNEEGVQHYCNIWWNGIAWESTAGIDITVHITNNRVIRVVGTVIASADRSWQCLTDVISDILSTVRQLSPKLAAGAYIVHPPITATTSEDITDPSAMELFPVEGIRNSIQDNEEFTFSLKDKENHWNKTRVADLFGDYIPSLEDIERINWTQLKPSQPQFSTEPSQPQLSAEPNQPQLSAEPSKPQSQTGPNQQSTLSQTVYCEFLLQDTAPCYLISLSILVY